MKQRGQATDAGSNRYRLWNWNTILHLQCTDIARRQLLRPRVSLPFSISMIPKMITVLPNPHREAIIQWPWSHELGE